MVQQVALNAYSTNSGITKSELHISKILPISIKNQILFSIYNFKNGGFIIVSNDDVVEPILGYGFNSNIDFEKIPESLEFLLNEYKNEILDAKKNKLEASAETLKKWKDCLDFKTTNLLKSYTIGTNLLETEWDQVSGFQTECPNDPSTGVTSVVGCGGVALGQILYYWNCRVFPDGSVTYTPDGFQNSILLNFYNQSYNWSAMDITAPDSDNKTFLYHCAVSLESDFSSGSTSHEANAFPFALRNYFGFNSGNVISKSANQSTWTTWLRAEIDSMRPVYYFGIDYGATDTTAHSWVVDGYRTSDNRYHCNWGWGGDYDGWFALNNLSTANGDFTSSQGAVMNIYPKLDGCNGDFDGDPLVCASNESYSITLPSLASVVWSKSSNLDQVGGNTGTTYTINEGAYGSNSSGTITATIKNSQGNTFMTRTKTVWVGAPYVNPNTIEFYNSEASTGKLCANAFGNDFSFTTQSEWNSFDIKLTNLAETQTICSFTIYDTQGDLDLCSVNDGTYRFWVRGTNDCGTASNWSKTSVEFEDCGGQFFLMMTPNPSSSQTTLSIVSTSTEKVDEPVEWELEVFDATQNLKEKRVKIKGTDTKINTENWREGVYLIRVNYNNEILQGKLVVKK